MHIAHMWHNPHNNSIMALLCGGMLRMHACDYTLCGTGGPESIAQSLIGPHHRREHDRTESRGAYVIGGE